jgi:chloride channel protein, CIC family
MITSSVSFLAVKPFEKHSIYSKKLAELGQLKTHNKDKYAMRKIDWYKLIDNNILTISESASLREYTQIIAKSTRNLFVVIDNQNHFMGLLNMDEHRETIFKQELYDLVRVKDLIFYPDVVAYDTDSGEVILKKFKDSGHYNLPVISKRKQIYWVLIQSTCSSSIQRFCCCRF